MELSNYTDVCPQTIEDQLLRYVLDYIFACYIIMAQNFSGIVKQTCKFAIYNSKKLGWWYLSNTMIL